MTSTSSEYVGDVNGVPLHQDGLTTVPLDTPGFTDHGYGFVTGQAYNAASDFTNADGSAQPVEFPVAGPAYNDGTAPPTPIPGGTSGSAKFVFVTEDGCVNAWRSNTATAMPSARLIVDYSKTAAYPADDAANPVFTGDALTTHAAALVGGRYVASNHLFVADFRNDHIQVFDNAWHDVTSSYHFQTPAAVGDLHPFNVADLGGHLFVAYAEFDPAGDEGQEQVSAAGDGLVVEYDEAGNYLRTFGAGGQLDSPWGMTVAPATFGRFGGDLLVANFGDGTVSAFDPTTGAFADDLRDAAGDVISVDGIWGLAFGNGVSLGDANALYFTSGPNGERDGLFGKLTVAGVPEPTGLGLATVAAAGLLGRRRRGA